MNPYITIVILCAFSAFLLLLIWGASLVNQKEQKARRRAEDNAASYLKTLKESMWSNQQHRLTEARLRAALQTIANSADYSYPVNRKDQLKAIRDIATQAGCR